MKQPRLGFRNKSVSEQLQICEKVLAHFKRAPQPQQTALKVDEIAALIADVRESVERVEVLKAALKAETSRRNELLAQACEQVRWTQGYQMNFVGRDREKLEAAGIDVKDLRRRRVGLPDKVTNVRAVPATHSTDIALRWERSVRRCAFQVEVRRDDEPDTEWRIMHTCVQCKCVIRGLKSGELYWFRICAHNAHGSSPWSNPISARVR